MNNYDDNPMWGKMGRGCFTVLLLVVFGLLMSISMCSCKTTRIITETVTKSDTVTVKRDSIIIHERIDTVEIALPQSSQVIEIPVEHHTVSVLTDRYYTSTAAVFGGRLRHSLMSNPGATLTGAATVHDTVKVYVDSTMINNQSNHSEIKEVPVNRLYWWQKALMFIGLAGLAAGIGWLLRKRG